ncbi:unnamed protein product [Symbiodinium sp. CCMP2592]|nr:unnamed protein product [Symbiodinium sp. CCMP2592]
MQVLELEPTHSKALWLLGDILKTSQDFEGAIQQLQTLVRIAFNDQRTQPNSPDGHISLAQCYEATKQYGKAAQIYKHILESLCPGRTDVHFALGKDYFFLKQYRQAVIEFDRDHERAISLAESAAHSHPHPEVMHFLGEEYARVGEQQKAAQCFSRGLELEPNHLPSLMELGQLAYRQANWHEAERLFTRICEVDRTDLDAIRWLALVKYKLRKDESCRQCCEGLLRVELQLQAGSADERWLTSLRLPSDVSMADVCQSIAKGYLVRKQVVEANNWLKQAQNFAPSAAGLKEAQLLLAQKGATVNPQEHRLWSLTAHMVEMDAGCHGPVSLVKQGGFLWKAWVACHYERRLKRQDYLSTDVTSTCDFLLENLSVVPLRCLGHLMLGILRILLRQAEDLESKADEVRTSLQTSISAGSGLPTVPTLAASAVTLRNLEKVQSVDFGAAGLDVLMEELPEMEVEASLEEGRRHVAPLDLITLSPEPTSSAKRKEVDAGDDDFGAPSAEDLASLAAMGQAALAQIQAEASSPQRDPQTSTGQKEALEGSAGRESLPPVDFLLGAASSPSQSSPARDMLMQAEGEEDLAAAAEAAALEAEAFAAEAEQAAQDAEAAARCLQEVSELPVDFLLKDAEAEDACMQPLLLPNTEVDECLELLPREEEALEIQEAQPRQKRRRKRVWLDEKATVIPEKKYREPRKITHESPYEFGLLLPHKSPTVGLTTFFADLGPLLCAPLRRAADIGARQRRAKAEDSTLPSPPRAPLASLAAPSLPAALQEEAPLLEGEVPMGQAVAVEAISMDIDPGTPKPPSPDLAALLPEALQVTPPPVASEAGAASPVAEQLAVDVPGSPKDLPANASPGPEAARESVETAPEQPSPVLQMPEVPTTEPINNFVDEEVASLPPAKRQAQQNGGGDLVAIKVRQEFDEVKTEEDVEVDFDKVSAKQGRELRTSLLEDSTLSFLDLCDLDHCNAEAAACRFVDLLSLHMTGAVSLKQDKPYEDIAVVRGTSWEACAVAFEGIITRAGLCIRATMGVFEVLRRESLLEPAGGCEDFCFNVIQAVQAIVSNSTPCHDQLAFLHGPDFVWKVEVDPVFYAEPVESIKNQQMSICLTLNDGTGRISCNMYSDSDSASGPEFQDGDYIRVFGHLRQWDQQEGITAHRIVKVESANEIAHHTIEVAHVHLSMVGKLVKSGVASGQANRSSPMSSMPASMQPPMNAQQVGGAANRYAQGAGTQQFSSAQTPQLAGMQQANATTQTAQMMSGQPGYQQPQMNAQYARQAAEYGDEASGFSLGYELHAYLGKLAEAERSSSMAEKHYSAALASKAGDETAMLGLARVLHGKDKAQARRLYEEVVSRHPDSAEGHRRLAELHLEADEALEAYRLAAQAAKLAPRDVSAHLCLGYASLKLGRADEAARSFEQAAVLQPSALDVPAMVALASLYRKAGRDEEAITYYKRVLDMRPGDYECTLSLANIHADRGVNGASQALHYFRAALQCRPTTVDSRSIYLQMAAVQIAINSWKDAQQTLESAVREHPDDAEIFRQLLSIYEQLKDSKGQYYCHRRLVQLGAATPATQTSYAALLLSEDRVREAREQLSQVIKLEPTNLAALLKLAHCHRQESRESNLEEARKLYEQVLHISPSNSEALEGAAFCARKGNQLDQAVQFYQQCLKVNATAEGPLYYLGDILYRQHRHAECQFYLSRLVETNCATDYKTGALYLLAKSYVSLDEYEEAEKQARLGLALKPNHPHFLFILALVKNRMADFDSSIATLKKAFLHLSSADSDNLKIEIHDWLAQAYERKGEYTNALAELSLALKQEPSHVSSLITQGLIHMQMKELEQAETSYRKALAVEKNHALALVRLGYCKLLAADLQEAILLFQRALQQRCGTVALPRSVKGSARIYMALAMMGQQDMDGALYQLAEARKNHRNFENLCSSGKDSIVKGECEGLVGKLRSMSDLDVTLAQAWQLVELMAKELEMGLRDSSAGKGSSPESGQSPARDQFAASSPESQAKKVKGEATSSPATDRRAWVSNQTSAEAAGPGPERRAWISATEAKDARSTGQLDQGGKILLAKHEMIDFAKLTQKDCLGSGGFGAVYRGYFGTREVAIKKLFCEDGGNISPLQLEELEKEVVALRSLSHPRLVGFIGACLQPPNLCIVTEFMPGGSLHHLLHKARTPLTLGTQSKIAIQVCEGVDFLHGHAPPVVHRDLKSLNIVLDRIYNAKICDFGLTQSMEKTHITLKEGGNGGSPRYMAPECYDCKGKITEKVDVWALGCILVEVFGGPLPYDDCSNIQQIVAKVLIDKQLPYIPHHLPAGLRPIVEDCFQFDFKQRASAQDVFSRMKLLGLPG